MKLHNRIKALEQTSEPFEEKENIFFWVFVEVVWESLHGDKNASEDEMLKAVYEHERSEWFTEASSPEDYRREFREECESYGMNNGSDWLGFMFERLERQGRARNKKLEVTNIKSAR